MIPSRPGAISGRLCWSVAPVIHALAWFLIGYSDGIVYTIMKETETSGYMVYITPIIAIYIIYLYFIFSINTPIRLISKQLLFIFVSIIVLIFQIIFIGEFYLIGYAQYIFMIGLVFFITDIFRANEIALRPYFARGMLVVHYFICAYAILSWFTLRITGEDISLYITDIDSLVGFAANRTSGLHREPSWAAYALASSYLAVLSTRPDRMLLPQIAYLMAIAVTGAGAGLILTCLFIAHQVLTTNKGNAIVKLGFLGGLGFLTLIVFSNRISDVLTQSDPSSQMRLESSIVALEVIEATFPLGTGFGNYQDVAVFEPTIWGSFLNITESTYYKSDILTLNLIAELGFWGIIMQFIFLANFFSKGNILVFSTVAVMTLTSGTIILPAYLTLAAITGLAQGRAARLAEGSRVPSP